MPRAHVGLTCGIFDPVHYRRIGPALWLFCWAVRRNTSADGWVLGGRWLTRREIGGEAGIGSVNTVRSQLERLEREGYLVITSARGRGIRVRVVNPKKWRAVTPSQDHDRTNLDHDRTLQDHDHSMEVCDRDLAIHLKVKERERERAHARLRRISNGRPIGHTLEGWLVKWFQYPPERTRLEVAVAALPDSELVALVSHWVERRAAIHTRYRARHALDDLAERASEYQDKNGSREGGAAELAAALYKIDLDEEAGILTTEEADARREELA